MPLQNVIVEEKDVEMVLARLVFCGFHVAIFDLYVALHATLLT
jgi:hypothetical protein